VAAPIVTRPRLLRRRLLLLAGGLLSSLLLLLATAPSWLAGPRLGRLVERNLPRTRGHVHVGGGSWGWGTVWALLRHHPAALVFDDVSLTDPDGTVVLRARRISGALLRGHAPEGVTIQDLRVEDGAWRMAEATDRHGIGFLRALELAPSPDGGGEAGARQPAGGLRYIRVEGAELIDLDVDFDLPGWALSLRRLHGHGWLALERRDRGADLFTFSVLDATAGAGGRLSVLDGRWRNTLPFSAARITRIAATAAAPDTIELDAPEIATGRSLTDVHGSFTGVLPAPGPPRRPGIALRFTMRNAADAAAAVATARGWTPRLAIAGAGATLAMAFDGSLSAPRLQVHAAGFDVRYGDAAARAGRLDLEVLLVTRQFHLRELTFTSPAGGRLLANGHLDDDRAAGTLSFEHFDGAPYLPAGLRQVAAGRWDGDVEAHVDLTAGTAALDRVALTVARPPGTGRPTAVHALTRGLPLPPRTPGDAVLRLGQTRLQHGTLLLPRVTVPVAGGQVTASGAIRLWDPKDRAWLASPAFDLSLDAARVSADQLLGTALVAGRLSLHARSRGTFDSLTLRARLPAGQLVRILGTRFELPRTVALSFEGGTLALAPLTLVGAAGGTVTATGTVTTGGRLALTARVTGLALRPLIAGAAAVATEDVPVDGRLGARLSLTGEAAAPAISGTLTVEGVQLGGRAFSDGALTLTTGPRGELRLHGTLLDGIPLEAVVQRGASGARVAATLTLTNLQLAPFLRPFLSRDSPGGSGARASGRGARLPLTSLTGEVSGLLSFSLSPGAKPKLEANLSQLAFSAGGTTNEALTMRSAGPVHAVVQAGQGRLEAVRFSGTAGDLRLSGEWRDGRAAVRGQGQVNAAALAPFVPRDVTSLGGALAVDVRADLGSAGAPTATGSVTIAAPLHARLVQLPFDLVASSGRLSMTDHGATVEGLVLEVPGGRLQAGGGVSLDGPATALSFRGAVGTRVLETFARGYLRDAEGQVRLAGRLDGPLARPVLTMRMNVGGVAFTLMPGANRVRFASGDVAVTGSPWAPALALSNVDLRVGDGNQLVVGGDPRDPGRLRLGPGGPLDVLQVDLPAQGRVRSLATPVAIIDSAAFGVRLSGVPGRSLRLAGDVFIDAAHVPPGLRRPKKPAPAKPGDTARAVLNATRLDLHIRSKPRAVTVEIAHVPDLHAALDYHLGGTVGAPAVQGSVKPAGFYSAVLLFLARLLD